MINLKPKFGKVDGCILENVNARIEFVATPKMIAGILGDLEIEISSPNEIKVGCEAISQNGNGGESLGYTSIEKLVSDFMEWHHPKESDADILEINREDGIELAKVFEKQAKRLRKAYSK